MSQTLLNRTTATKENALSVEERDAFLSELRIGRLASQREDGWPHVTPIWYVWDDGRFVLTLGKSRRHLVNIARDPHVTLCVDEDPRTTDLTKSPRAVVCFGLARLVEDEADGGGETPLQKASVTPGWGDRMDITAAMENLPPGARQIFVLHDIEGYKHEEIAEMCGITAGGSKAQLHRARLLLREALTR